MVGVSISKDCLPLEQVGQVAWEPVARRSGADVYEPRSKNISFALRKIPPYRKYAKATKYQL